MLERLSWRKIALEWCIFCFPAVLLSFFIGHFSWLLLLSTMCALLWGYYNQLKLSHWLWLDRRITPPNGGGSWEPLFYGLHRLQNRNRKRRKELTRLVKRFRLGAESLQDAVIVSSDNGSIVWCNRLAQHLLGFQWPEDNGQLLFNLIRYPQFADYMNQKNYSEPLMLVLNNGRHVEFRVTLYLKKQLLIMVRDMTALNQLENSRRQFIANVSHELRTPLTVLSGYLEILSENELDMIQQAKAVSMMSEQATRMDNLINQLLALSRIESAPFIDLSKKVDVPKLLHTLQSEIAQQNAMNSIVFNFDIDSNLSVYGDEVQLYSAMSNLVYNAFHHADPSFYRSSDASQVFSASHESNSGSKVLTIEVSWKNVEAGACFSVKDNGQGIPAEHLSHLTERFYRVDDARSRDSGGTGLGLAIVKQALAHHHGILEIDSIVGEGAHFRFTLPKILCV